MVYVANALMFRQYTHSLPLSIAASAGKDKLQRDKICSKTNHDPPSPITNENIYTWYLMVSYHQ